MKKPVINIHLLNCALLIAIAVGVYWNSLQGDFIWDDRGLILGNADYLRDWKNLFTAFVNPLFGNIPYYRPLITGWFITDYHLWGTNPFGYHYTNLILHTVNALLVYHFILLLFKEARLAFFTSLLFTVHPVQSESVAWISGRNDMLLTFFALISIILYLQRNHLKGIKGALAYSGFLASYACALLTKENGVVLPLLLMLIGYFFPEIGKCKSKDYCGLVIVTVLYLIARVSLIGQIGPEGSERDFAYLLYNVIGSYAYYFKMLLIPLFQSAVPTINASSFSTSSFALVLCLSGLAVLCCKRFKEMSFAILWIAISLLPVCGIIPMSIPAQDHRLYLGSVCFSMLLPLGVYRLGCLHTETHWLKKAKTIALFMLPSFIVLYSAQTVTRNRVWQSDLSFWLKTVHDSPNAAVARNNLGIAYARIGAHEKAIREFKIAMTLCDQENIFDRGLVHAQHVKLLNNLGQSYYQVLKNFLQNPDTASPATILSGSDSETDGDDVQRLYALSSGYYQRALKINHASDEVHNNLGDLFYVMKNYIGAEEEYRKAVAFSPANATYYNNLGLVYYARKNYDDAEKNLSRAIALQPDFFEARNNLSLIYMSRGRYQKALEELEQALSANQDNPGVYFNLALVYLRGFKNSERAMFYLKESLKLTHHVASDEMLHVALKNLERNGT